jgi:hypothetical protein
MEADANVSEKYIASIFRETYNLKIKAVRFSETSLTKFKAAWRCKPQDHSWVFSASILTKNFRRQIPLLVQKTWACQNFVFVSFNAAVSVS